jgi:hypothetical protein
MTTRGAIDILETVQQILRDAGRLESLSRLERSNLPSRAESEVSNIDDVVRFLKNLDREVNPY